MFGQVGLMRRRTPIVSIALLLTTFGCAGGPPIELGIISSFEPPIPLGNSMYGYHQELYVPISSIRPATLDDLVFDETDLGVALNELDPPPTFRDTTNAPPTENPTYRPPRESLAVAEVRLTSGRTCATAFTTTDAVSSYATYIGDSDLPKRVSWVLIVAWIRC